MDQSAKNRWHCHSWRLCVILVPLRSTPLVTGWRTCFDFDGNLYPSENLVVGNTFFINFCRLRNVIQVLTDWMVVQNEDEGILKKRRASIFHSIQKWWQHSSYVPIRNRYEAHKKASRPKVGRGTLLCDWWCFCTSDNYCKDLQFAFRGERFWIVMATSKIGLVKIPNRIHVEFFLGDLCNSRTESWIVYERGGQI